ncbi:DUF3515 family protein [Amnibacterium sp. CER49]|uniref:DUF3515 family protein n=1 Tax=Amnibacterium sp. CER49 TaxID=3039161 RepID=UPI002449943C|nr:DUF3515 family protein [Amnibacterium sp. CER49]MDH2442794.1 DUF3515 family protein [Amnibacterium sp. CER49]
MRRALLAVPAAAAALALAGCAPTVAMTPAPDATARACAALIVRLPASLGTAGKRETDAQGTAAWGSAPDVTLTCGVTPPGPTTAVCLPVDGVDWVIDDRSSSSPAVYVATTFGRTPATRVVLQARGAVASSDALPPISEAVKAAMPTVDRRCIASPPPAASASPSPTP